MNRSPWYNPYARRSDGLKRRGSTRYEKEQRLLIFRHYAWTCQLCHQPINPRLPRGHSMVGEIHHLTPTPGYSLTHCVPAHRECNRKAGQPWAKDPQPRGQKLW